MTHDTIALQLKQKAVERQAWGRQLQADIAAAGPMSFTRFLRERATRWPGRDALKFRDRSCTYEQLLDRIDRASQGLHNRGVRAGQSVALMMNNSDHYVVWYLAILGLGAVAVPLNNRLAAREAAFVLRHSESILLVTEPAFDKLVQDVQNAHEITLPLVLLDPAEANSGLAASAHVGEPDISAATPAALYYTSGTTGQPKGVIHTHSGLIADALQSTNAWECEFEGVKSLAITPLFHIAVHTIFLPVLFVGGSLVIDTYDTQATMDMILREEITAFFGVPSILLLVVEKAKARGLTFGTVKTLMFGAAPMTISKLSEVQALFPNASLIHGMGLTESGGTLVTLPGFAAAAHAGSVGIPMPAVEVAIFDEHHRAVPSGQIGELVAKGPNVMLGYFRNEKATQETLRNGWLHTGDLGYQDAEGLVYLVDRKKDMIIRGGENIYSSEVEQVLLRHPAVKSVAVVGQPDALFGEQVAVFVVADPAAPQLTDAELVAHCRKELADYKVPVTFRYLPELPLTATGKIKKNELRQTLPPYTRPAPSK